jgi:NADPH:quinone reductase-like Zn-dependent oxidoreductase
LKAAVIHEFGAPDVFRIEDVPRPVPDAGEALIKVHAAGINPVDWKTRQAGGILKANGIPLPYILGWDISGVIEEIGVGAGEFVVGQEVYGLVRFPAMGSAYAEYVTAPVSEITAKPATIDHIHAAGVPLVALTAWQALFEHAYLQAGQRILVQGAAGGVGHVAVQIAKAHGAQVIGTASARNSDYLREIGVDQVVDYHAEGYADTIHDVDVVFETVSADNAARVLKTLKAGGFLVSCAGLPAPEILAQYHVRSARFLVRPEASQLAEITELIDADRLKVNVDAVFPLAEVGKAHALGEQGRTRGKIVLQIV